MAVPVPMLALSPTMTEGTIAAWKFKEGDEIKRGSVLCEVETDKAVMDYEASVQGTLLKIVASPGTAVKVGDLIAVIGTKGEDISGLLAQSAAPPQGPAQPQTQVQSQVLQPQAEALVQAQPQSQAPSPVQPVEQKPVQEPAFVSLNTPLSPGSPSPSSPLARKLAYQAGIDLRHIQGSGPGGRIVKRDVSRYLEGLSSSTGPRVESAGASASGTGAGKTVPVTRLRQTITRRLGESMHEAPHFYLRMAIDMERLINLRNSYNQSRKDGFSVSFNALFMKLSAMAVSKHPQINSSWMGDQIKIYPQVDVALAVALDDGLVAPVVRACERKGVEEIERELRDLIARAKAGNLKPEDYEGATFTISNLGAWGVEEFTAIINPPGSAILAVGAVKKEAVVQTDSQGEDHIVIRPMLRATLSSDHRTIDGAVAAAFMKDLVALWEDPAKALF
ncbi:MAG: 2-oxo acid dehydrogenase subunit E2 [Treponema sp.]|nr:2-oxo acid dehydrogenase subunit E2 [Treponema sp.]